MIMLGIRRDPGWQRRGAARSGRRGGRRLFLESIFTD
jgi:hypothetical protein